ncbi:MAG: divergent PAP2 family protein [Deltaproteobacteria bacterium]|nr:divergent PAP2 family protein [Deltaproteobacteria bacterium]
MIAELLQNRVLIAAVAAWMVGQSLKFPLEYILNKRWNWGIIFSSGGLPSSHSALVTAVALSIGFQDGFDTPLFALAVAIAMIIIYDAAGVRRQAGIHAERINEIMKNFIESRHFPEEDLKEMLGHTPFEVITGVLLGVLISWAVLGLIPG